ncbi:MAG: hypothetical protein LBQ59_05135 [Candidatus Peribacteria bacterium]|nr:hypothetical protein [Candidatus Peribacteria bacterium]
MKNDFENLDKARENIKKARIKFFVSNVLLTPISIIPNDNIQNVTNLVS